MRIYNEFSVLYASGPYKRYSRTVSKLLPNVLKRFRVHPRAILDVACGDGTFAVEMARKHFRVTGVDFSSRMLRFARARAEKAQVKIKFIQKDMRQLTFKEDFDLVTCWYDSLNYLLRLEDLEQTFQRVSRALRKDGLFIFDMATQHHHRVRLQQAPVLIQQDNSKFFEIHRRRFDPKTRIASRRITGFIRKGRNWHRVDETHRQHAYSLSQIRLCLKKAALTELACWGSLETMAPPIRNSGRYWFVAQRSLPGFVGIAEPTQKIVSNS